VTEEEPAEGDGGDGGDASDPIEELREELQKPVAEEERELTYQEREQLRRATAGIRQALNPQIQSIFKNINRIGALAKFSADMDKLGRTNVPDSFLKGVLGKRHHATFQKFLPKTAVEPLWIMRTTLINGDLYKMSGLGQSNLTKLNSLLAKNADFGFDKTAAKLVVRFAAEQTSWLKTIGPLLARIKTSFYPANLDAIEDLEFEEVESVVMLDGIALYGVPRTEIARKLVRAANTAERRTILGRRWKAIASDCRTALEGCTSGTLAPHVKFGLRALDARLKESIRKRRRRSPPRLSTRLSMGTSASSATTSRQTGGRQPRPSTTSSL